jgi:hypothetical protein
MKTFGNILACVTIVAAGFSVTISTLNLVMLAILSLGFVGIGSLSRPGLRPCSIRVESKARRRR